MYSTYRARVGGAVNADVRAVPVDASAAVLASLDVGARLEELLEAEGVGNGDGGHGGNEESEELHDEGCWSL